MNDENVEKINEISDYFKERGFECKREVKTLHKDSDDFNVLDTKLNRIDICCQKDKNIFCAEVEDSQYQCVRNRRAMEKARTEWVSKGFDVSTCQLGVKENFKEVCDIPIMEKSKENIKETKQKVINKNIQQFRIPKTRLGFW